MFMNILQLSYMLNINCNHIMRVLDFKNKIHTHYVPNKIGAFFILSLSVYIYYRNLPGKL